MLMQMRRLGERRALCYIDVAMKRALCVTNSSRLSAALMALIIGSLCFSVGEGLRLTPFPVTTSLQIEEPDVLSLAKEAGGLSLLKHGPLDVPSQLQKRTKRQTTDFAFQPSAEDRPLVTLGWNYRQDESVLLTSSLFVSRPAGRAPPLVS
jgi:hypothetical protein